jgi:hypothetical protein
MILNYDLHKSGRKHLPSISDATFLSGLRAVVELVQNSGPDSNLGLSE